MTTSEYREFASRMIDEGVMPCQIDGRVVCMYRGDGGTKCAIGILIDDRDVEPAWNNGGWDSIPSHIQEKVRIEGLSNSSMRKIQNCHDDSPLENFREEFFSRLDALPFMKESTTCD